MRMPSWGSTSWTMRRSPRWSWPGAWSRPRSWATIDILNELGVRAPHRNTLAAALKRATARDYRDTLARACRAHSVRTAGASALILYDVTTLHFENGKEDDLRRVGMSKEHRVDPQVQVVLLAVLEVQSSDVVEDQG